MNRTTYRVAARAARLGTLGPLCFSVSGADYQWLLAEVYDVRFPRVALAPLDLRRVGDVLGRRGRGGIRQRLKDRKAWLVAFHQVRGWLNCGHKSFLRLATEHKAMTKGERGEA